VCVCVCVGVKVRVTTSLFKAASEYKKTKNICMFIVTHTNPHLRTHRLINTYACRKREGGKSTYA